jgi:RNA polymerase sigma factor (sigma-70 family)
MEAAAHLALAREMARKVRRGPLSRDEAQSAAALGIARAVAAWPGPGPVPEDYAAQAARLTIRMEIRSAIRWRRAQAWHLGRGSLRGSPRGREPSPEAVAEAAELRGRVHAAIGRLPARQRAVASGRLEGRTLPEIAPGLGLTTRGAYALWRRAAESLRADLDAG